MSPVSRHEKAAFAALDIWLGHRVRFGGLPGAQVRARKNGANMLYPADEFLKRAKNTIL
ncbi:MAG: hypothetical protein IT560_11415 [Alphaproteobacteria bacterium]|nr:hypothetical protein [Alphaproteobacteria bacterium]